MSGILDTQDRKEGHHDQARARAPGGRRDLARDDMTMLIVSHERRFAYDVSTTVIFMHEGRIHEAGPPKKVFIRPSTPRLSEFNQNSSLRA
jgi:ABC-type histidine transport system ATPase subunit